MGVKKILMLVGDYVEDYEAMVPFQMLTMVGHQVDAVGKGDVSDTGEGDPLVNEDRRGAVRHGPGFRTG